MKVVTFQKNFLNTQFYIEHCRQISYKFVYSYFVAMATDIKVWALISTLVMSENDSMESEILV